MLKMYSIRLCPNQMQCKIPATSYLSVSDVTKLIQYHSQSGISANWQLSSNCTCCEIDNPINQNETPFNY